MSAMARQWRASYAFVERNLNLVKRYWSWEVVWLVYSIADSMAVSFIGLGTQQIAGGNAINTKYLVIYLLIGTLVWRFLSTIFFDDSLGNVRSAHQNGVPAAHVPFGVKNDPKPRRKKP